MRLILSLLIALFLSINIAFATQPAVEVGGTTALTTGTHTVFLDGGTGTHQYHHVVIWTSSGSANMNINLNPGATAAVTDPILYGGGAFSYGFTAPPAAATNQLNYKGASTAGTINWMAW